MKPELHELGNHVHEVWANDRLLLFSYETVVAAWIPMIGYIKDEKKYSVTTSKHVTQWLRGKEYKTLHHEAFMELINGGSNE